jgi:hypothetical protein
MAGIPKVKITFDADFDQLKKGVKGAQGEVEGFSSKIGKFGKVAAAAFAAATVAAAAYAGKLLIDGVKSAIADEAAQAKLALTLKNVTGATDATVKATEAYITKTAIAFGVTDDELRPSLERLARATGDVEKAQKLQALALDISAGSGKSLEAVTNALGKATEGSTTALGKLGVGLTASQLKTLSMDEITKKLADTFENQAAAKADTFQGKLARLQVAFDEGKETVGSFILDAITPMVTLFVDKVIPTLSKLASSISVNLEAPMQSVRGIVQDGVIPAVKGLYDFFKDFLIPFWASVLKPAIDGIFSAFNQVKNAINANSTELEPLFNLFKSVAVFVRDTLGPLIGTVLKVAFEGLGFVIGSLISIVGDVTNAVTTSFTNIKNFFTNVKDFLVKQADTIFSPLYNGMKAVLNAIIGIWNKLDFGIDISVPDWVPLVGGKGFKVADIFPDVPMLAKGGIVTSPTLAMIGEAGPEAVVPLNKAGGMGNTINLTVNGAIDPEGTARAIINILNNSTYRGTLGSGAFA